VDANLAVPLCNVRSIIRVISSMKSWKKWIWVLAILALVGGAALLYWNQYLKNAHSSFEKYYDFRGCKKLIERTDTYGVCLTDKGETIKIVKYEGKWFLDGDLPCKTGICW
jgi:hypothetical protein